MEQKFSYSVLMALYRGDSPEYLKISLDSMLNQTIPPEEIVIGIDGPIGEELCIVLDDYKKNYGDLFSIYSFKENRGAGAMLHDVIPLCRNDFIARMDPDDYSVPSRVEKEFAIFERFPWLSAVGSNVDEFYDDIYDPVSHVIMPETPEDCLKFARKRCPFRQPSLLVKKADAIAAGGYRDFFRHEDYDFIVRLMLAAPSGKGGLYNVQEVLVYMRISKDFYKRRGGIKLMIYNFKMKAEFLKMGFISVFDFIISGFGQAFVCLMPVFFREWFYKKFLRG